MVHLKDVVGIFDIQSKEREGTASFLTRNKTDKPIDLTEIGEVKSFVVTADKVHFSPISSLTLKKRALYMDTNGKIELE